MVEGFEGLEAAQQCINTRSWNYPSSSIRKLCFPKEEIQDTLDKVAVKFKDYEFNSK